LRTGKRVSGGRWFVEDDYPFERIPVFVRPKTLLLLGPQTVTTPDYAYGNIGVEVRLYEVESEENCEAEVYNGQGTERIGTVSRGADGKIFSGSLKLL
jgi:alpha-glucosidase (family GH31 glycosyl hydrolase)